MRKPNRKKNMFETQLDYIKVLIDMKNYTDAVEKLEYIKTKLETILEKNEVEN